MCVGGIRMSTITRSGLVLAHEREQLGRVAGLPDDLEAGALEQAGQALAEQDVVVGQDHSGASRDACVGLSLGGRHPRKYPLASIR